MMTLMSCRRAEKLMPLYAAGDLPSNRLGRAVAAHAASCQACATLAEEFRASREWAREAGAVPEFGEEFYESLRAGVLDRVRRDTRPAGPSHLSPPFGGMFAGRRLAFAASLALAASALALAFYFVRGTQRTQRDIAITPPGDLITLPQSARNATTTPNGPTHVQRGQQQQPSQHGPTSDDRRPARQRPKTAGGGFKRTPTLHRAAPTHEATRAPELAASSSVSAQQGTAPAAPRAETASVARIEIQTADPNIRIIWLAPSSGDEAEPGGVDPDR